MNYILSFIVFFIFILTVCGHEDSESRETRPAWSRAHAWDNRHPPHRRGQRPHAPHVHHNDNCAPCPPPPPPPPAPPTERTCPCVKAPGSSQCVTFDPSVQAATLEEALYSFVDRTGPHQEPIFSLKKDQQEFKRQPKPSDDVSRTTSDVSHVSQTASRRRDGLCQSAACNACLLKVVSGFAQSFTNGSSSASELRDIQQMRQRYSKEARGYTCPSSIAQSRRADVLMTAAHASPKRRLPDATIQQIVAAMQPDNGASSKDAPLPEDCGNLRDGRQRAQCWNEQARRRMDYGRRRHRVKRQGEGDLIGVATKLGCDYRRGTKIAQTKFVGLCNICWQWRKLPEKYFPTYLNEVSCDGDNQCLSGWGKCRPVLRSVNVLFNTASTSNPHWQQESIFTVAACECQVETGSPLHTFVAR